MTATATPVVGGRARTATATVGMVGGGQLARMTQQAAIGLDIDLHVLTPDPHAPAVLGGAQHVPGRPDDLDRAAGAGRGV